MLNISESKKKKCPEILASNDTAFNKFRKIFEIYKSQIVGTELYYAALGLIDSDKIVDTAIDEESDQLYAGVKPDWPIVGKCEICGGDIRRDTSVLLSSNPPKSIGMCSKCGSVTYVTKEEV